jgi:ketosteroid isomerase-like protein
VTRLRSIFVALTLALMGVLVGHSPALAQQASLREVASTVAGCWTRRDADGIAELLSRDGVALHLFDESHPAAGVRQARAALAELFERGGSARITRVEELGGSPQRGFAELAWDAQSLRYVVFVGFVREGDGWRIAEIRVLR